MPTICVVYGCTNRSNREKEKGFFRVPKIVVHKGCPSVLGDVESVDWAPTVNLGYQETTLKSQSFLQRKHRMKLKTDQQRRSEFGEAILDYMLQPATLLPVNGRVEQPNLEDAHVQLEDFTQVDHSYCRSTVESNTCDVGTQCSKKLFYKDLLRTDALCDLHTGLPCTTFHLLAEKLLPFYSGSLKLDPTDQLLMTLMKLRLNLPQEYLADKFSVCQSSVRSIFVYWIDLMESHMRSFVPWLRKEMVVKKMPRCFKEHYPGTTCIIDYSEIQLLNPRILDPREQSYSLYYGQNTIKFMVAIAPCGLITFISPVYGGRCSDKFIISDSGFLEYLHSGDEVMVDRGFMIRDVLNERGVKLTIPPCTKRDFQLLENSSCSRNLAEVRIHMERVICRLKRFKVLSETMPVSLIPMMDKILGICAALCNLQGDTVHEASE